MNTILIIKECFLYETNHPDRVCRYPGELLYV